MDQSASQSKKKAEWFDIGDDRNTYVYVNGLPTSVTEEDFIDLMKKYGIIAKKTTPGNPFNVKLYKDDGGSFKGDALCCYARVESVELALVNLEGYQYDDTHVLHCEKAKFKMKGSYDPSKKPKVLDKKAKIKHKKTISKLLSWEPRTEPEVAQKKVILKYMFKPDEIINDATLLLELKEDVEFICNQERCEPKRVDIFDKHPDGVIAVTFSDTIKAEICIKALDNRYYAGRKVRAELWDGKTRYKIKETDEESQKRLEKWHEDILKSDNED